jgi:non-heme chloroperoxidase
MERDAGRAGRGGAEALALPPGEEHVLVTDDGAELAVSDAGRGPSRLLVHGWTNDRHAWALVAPRLVASGHRVVLYDQRGHGASTLGRGGLGIDRLARDLRMVLEALHLHDVVIGGHSLGGTVTQALLARDPEASRRVRAAVIASSTLPASMRPLARRLAAWVVGAPSVDRLLASPLGPRFWGRDARALPPDLLEATRRSYLATPGSVRRGLLESVQADLRADLPRIAVPVLVVTGSEDRFASPARARALADRIPGARVVVLAGAGHMLPFERPEALAAFLDEAAAPG